jgi:hypothetical protein
MPPGILLVLATAGLLLAWAATSGGPRAYRCGSPRRARRRQAPPTETARWTLGLRGWRTWRDGLSKSYQCASRHDAQEFICELAQAIESVDELSRLRSKVRGRVVRIHIRAPVEGGLARRVRSDAHFALRLDGLGRRRFCAPLFGPVNRV